VTEAQFEDGNRTQAGSARATHKPLVLCENKFGDFNSLLIGSWGAFG